LREEFEAVAAPFDDRGARTREYIEVMKELWTKDSASYKGEYYDLPECRMYPKPAQQPHPPIHFGGETTAALRRVADLGQGWYGFNRTPEEVPDALTKLDRLLEERGRSRDEIEISVCPYFKGVDGDALERYRDLGVDRVIAVLFAFDRDGLLTAADDLAKQLVEPARSM
jgi:alkanesulfonate monooxygenase SsuD/methylene tetrahydromethanopterin reductase-like flavin-dependent oxidoreductase (luciferase family)